MQPNIEKVNKSVLHNDNIHLCSNSSIKNKQCYRLFTSDLDKTYIYLYICNFSEDMLEILSDEIYKINNFQDILFNSLELN
jgi:hypothetical protein